MGTPPTAFNLLSGSNTNDSKPKPNKLNSECRYCHKKGHWAKECWKCIANEKKKNRNANVASNGNDSLSYSFTAKDTHFGNSWIGNSGANHHIVRDCNSFTEYFPVSGQFINGVGGIKTMIHGCRTVHVVMRSSVDGEVRSTIQH